MPFFPGSQFYASNQVDCALLENISKCDWAVLNIGLYLFLEEVCPTPVACMCLMQQNVAACSETAAPLIWVKG